MKYAALLLCYFIGSIPTAYVIVKAVKGIDIRTVGSGNVGATNAGRVMGKAGFISVFAVDMLKGFVPVYLVQSVWPEITLAAAVLVIGGHTYTVFLNFKGGKGVATAVGVFLAMAPVSLGVAAVVFGIVLLASRMVSLSSITAAAALAGAVLVLEPDLSMKIFTVLIAGFVIYKHKSNIGRIIRGEESRIGSKNGKSP
ncbi:glycerol-3-phosphate 1-O-acyltransferase PlsY [Limisalsivibrio acetivorans]|uniref:glycerol-3-phosphate 1-O-acyltransferase PlsY n=1 Tax=Limisalsivibrio acetivorans TaxID=1304888 RepID=UPI0003B5B621|nr:glycerol-3-phosphate 1-O-acyltransferase PlsY [Limisalsivibrio acetivorans]